MSATEYEYNQDYLNSALKFPQPPTYSNGYSSKEEKAVKKNPPL